MTCFGRPALAVAVVLMLAPLSREVRNAMTGAASGGVELARGGKPAYAPCAWAKPGRTCYAGADFPRPQAVATANHAELVHELVMPGLDPGIHQSS